VAGASGVAIFRGEEKIGGTGVEVDLVFNSWSANRNDTLPKLILFVSERVVPDFTL
jgi:hypothetical protein